MKKMILTLAIALSTLSAFAGEEDVNPKVLDAFKSEFTTAKEVDWTVSEEYYKAAFTYNNKRVFAYYNADGELLALTHYMSPNDLPLILLNSLKKNYSDYWISDLFEVAKPEGTVYYVTLEDAETKLVLKASGSGWTSHKKFKKA